MTQHEAFLGVGCDHLYPDCPSLATFRRTPRPWMANIGDKASGTVDPEGTDICGLCHQRWKAKQ